MNRNAVIGGHEVSLRVINCRDAQWLAQQLRPQHRTRRRMVGAAVQGQFLPHAPAAKTASFSLSDHHEVSHTPTDWSVIVLSMLQQA
jgi:hypothetical protein